MKRDAAETAANVLVSDFDGTMTRRDFYQLAIRQLLPPDVPDHWAEYRRGEISHFEALRRYFAAIRADRRSVLAVVAQMQLDAAAADSLRRLRQAGWDVVVASAGCRWYIDQLLREAGIELTVHANPGSLVEGRGVLMQLPTDSPFFCPHVGIDKAAIVRHHQGLGQRVAFAGDGFPDLEAALLVPPPLRWARSDLAESLRRRGEAFRPFDCWSQIGERLLGECEK